MSGVEFDQVYLSFFVTYLHGVTTDLYDTEWESDDFLSGTRGHNWPFRCLDVVIRGKSLNHTLRSFGVKIGATTFVITKASNDRNYFVDKKGTVCTWKWPHTKLLFILSILLSHCWWKLVY